MGLKKLNQAKSLNVVGVMSGTSLDDVDFVLCKVSRSQKKIRIQSLQHQSVSFPKELRKQLVKACRHELDMIAIAHLHHELGKFYAKSLAKVSSKKKWKFDLVGLHGQTVYHQPPNVTWQVGEAAYVQAALGVPVVCDFRVNDLALGGQGAPLATKLHQVLASHHFKNQRVSFHNLGGISNLTFIDKGKVQKAFDTGPANMLIDLHLQTSRAGKKFDKNGALASQGIPDQKILEKMLKHRYFAKSPPKSCGREEFGEVFLNKHLPALKKLRLPDQISTLTELTAVSIARSYKKLMPEIVVLCGGGAYNSYLKFRIQYHLPSARVITTEDIGWSPKEIEGGAFALLAALRVWEMAGNIPQTTGARKMTVLGKVG